MLRVRDIMTTDVLTVSPSTTLREAAELLSTRHIGGAPVVDHATPVGVVSASDILAFAAAVAEQKEDADEPSDDAWDDRPERDGQDDPPARFFTERLAAADLDVVDQITESASGTDALDRHTVAEVMTPRVVAVLPTADVFSAAACLEEADVHRVLVVERGRLLGIVTTTDITRAVSAHRLERHTYVFDGPGDRRNRGERYF
jgi:CBS domain-containing protein